MLIDRSDRTINICDEKQYSITKSYADVLRMKMVIFAEDAQVRKTLALTMVTTNGILPGIVQNEVVMDDLFEPA